jgi:hypothetical protein
MILISYWRRSISVKLAVKRLLARIHLPCMLKCILVKTVLCVMCVERPFLVGVHWWPISGFTLVRNPWFVMCVARHLISKQVWESISAHTRVRSHTPVTVVASLSPNDPLWWCIGATTLGRDPTSVARVAKPLFLRLCLLLTRGVIAQQVFNSCSIATSFFESFSFVVSDFNFFICCGTIVMLLYW